MNPDQQEITKALCEGAPSRDVPEMASPCSIFIRQNATGEAREVAEAEGWDEVEFIWTDGNYACDCNRSLFFRRAAEEDDDGEADCGSVAFSIRVKQGDTVVYDEWGDAVLTEGE